MSVVRRLFLSAPYYQQAARRSSTSVEARVWTLKYKCRGLPKLSDFECKSEILPPCDDGDVIIAAEWLSVDPYMRYRIAMSKPCDVIVGSQVAKVIESRNADIPVGSYVLAYPGWRSHARVSKQHTHNPSTFTKLPDFGPIRRSAALGILGMTGNTAYFGFLELCSPKAGETVVVNAAAGAVGSAVCQIAKIKGCRVVAFAGGARKCDYVRSLGVDEVHDYKSEDIGAVLKAAAPDGVNCYFDNVGGDFTAAVVPHMAEYGRISLCGTISTYNKQRGEQTAPPLDPGWLIPKQIRTEGFIVTRWAPRWMEGIGQLAQWIQEGKLKYNETVIEGFDNMPEAFIGLFRGDNIGKTVVQF
ncbi:prostaglandin reductase 1 [Hyalella azteca]|uniref:Prostaglandin reductase 1 n=1 Tax=Hyalella azteca TaxID=294128 RepID=A0A8B7PQ83_HYAAZ|nr:prostaglandin reductase 1 [Hyalella azteca]